MDVLDCESITSDVLKKAVSNEHNVPVESVEVSKISISSGSKKGDGFACKIAAVQFEASFLGQHLSKNYIAKYSPGGKKGEMLKMFKTFEQEGSTYTKLVPALQEMRRAKGMKPLAVAKCLYASSEDQLILLENLKIQGFQVVPKTTDLLSLEAVKLVLKELASFHATGYYFTKTYPGGFEAMAKAYPSILPRNYNKEGDQSGLEWLKKFFELTKAMFSTSVEFVKKFGSQDLFLRMEAFQNTIMEVYSKILQQDTKLRFITHGDAWYNNFLYKYSDVVKSEPTDVKMVDLQNTRIGRPGLELAYFFCSSIPAKLRQQHFDDLIRLYHNHFHDELKNLDETSEAAFSIEELIQDYNECSPYGLVQGLGHFQVLLVDEDSEADFNLENIGDKTASEIMLAKMRDEVMTKGESSVEYQNLIMGLVQEAADRKII